MGRTKAFLEIRIDGLLLGPVIVELYNDIVPRTTENFQSLCTMEKGFGYKGCHFHRIIEKCLCQTGDFLKHDGSGNKCCLGEGDTFDDENFIMKHIKPGLLSMANDGPNTNGSQFFITFAACPQLNDKNVVFGEVIDGMDIVKCIENCGTFSGIPKAMVTISDCGVL